jgi:hypothetical protein
LIERVIDERARAIVQSSTRDPTELQGDAGRWRRLGLACFR